MERKSMSRRIAFFVLVYLVSFTVTLAITRQRVTQNTTIEDLIEFMSSLSTRSPFSKLVQTTIPDFSSGYNSYPSKETQINMTIPGPSSGISTRPPKNTTSENNISFDSGFSYNISPLIKLVIWYPRNPPAGVPIDVYSEIIDTDTIVEVILSYYNGTTWINTTMTYNTTLGLYEGQIPPLPGDTNGSLKIYAKDEMELWTTSKEYNFTVLTQDTEKPVFINVTWNPREPFSNQSVDVTANITDNSGVEKAILEYYNGTQYLNITMEMDIRTGLFYATIPPLPEGTQVTFRMYAKDYSNNWATSHDYTYTVLDITPPEIIDVFWTPSEPAEGEIVTVYVNITDNVNVSLAILSYSTDGISWTNVSMSYNFSIDLWVGSIPGMSALTEVRFKIYANDTSGNWGVSDEYSYVVKDVSAPIIVNVSWEPSEPAENEPVMVYANITDNVGVSSAILSYSTDGVSWTNVSMSYDADSSLWVGSIPGMSALTEVRFKIYANDTSSNWCVSSEYSYVVRDVSSPTIIYVYWEPLEPIEYETVTVYANITDNVGLSSAVLSYSTDGISWTNVSMSYNSSIDLWVGSIPGMSALTEVRFKIYANDTSGNWGVSDEYSYTVRDLTPPTIEISSPVNDSYLAKSVIVVEWSASDNCGIDHYEVYVDGSPVNTSISSGVTSYTLSMSEGDHNITVVAVDLAGNTASDSIVIHVDLTSPTMEITSPEDGSYIAESIVTVKWSSSDNYGINHYEVYVDGSPVNTSIPADVISYMLNLSEGDHNITVLAFDLAGNMAFDSVVIHIDLHGPEFIRVWWIPEEPEEGASVTVYANITDMSGVREAILSYYNGSAWVNVTMEYNSSSGLWFGTIPGLPAGNVTFKIYAVDNAGNMSISPEYSYTVKPKPTTTTTTTTTTTPKKGISPAIIALPLIIAIVAIVIVILRTKKKTTEEA